MRVRKFKAVLALALAVALAAPTAAVTAPVTTVEAAAKVKLNATKKTLNVGKTYTLKLKNATGKVTWKSNKKTVATVTAKGKVKAVASGTATITATNKKKTYKCKITVKNPNKPSGMKDMQAGPVNVCYPSDFYADGAAVDKSYAWVAMDNKDGSDEFTQMLTLQMQYTGEEAYDYDTLLALYEEQISAESVIAVYEMLGIEGVEITNYELSAYEDSFGKAIRVAYHIHLEYEGEAVDEDAVVYLIGIENYIVEVDAEAMSGGDISTADEYAKTLLKTMTVL